MKRTVLEKIVALRGMIFRLEHPELVIKEMRSIFNMVEQLEDTLMKEKAFNALVELSIDMMKELDVDSLETALKILENIDDEFDFESKVVSVNIKVEEYLDTSLINIDKKVPYRKLLSVINKVRKNFNETEKYIGFLGYNKKDKHILISYSKDRYKDIIIDITKWNLSDEVAEIYAEGFSEFLQK